MAPYSEIKLNRLESIWKDKEENNIIILCKEERCHVLYINKYLHACAKGASATDCVGKVKAFVDYFVLGVKPCADLLTKIVILASVGMECDDVDKSSLVVDDVFSTCSDSANDTEPVGASIVSQS